MFVYPEINPIAFSLGPIHIAWYGLMYLLGFVAAYWLAMKRTKKDWSPLVNEQIEDLIFYSAVGVIVGGRLGYMLFYDTESLISDPIPWLARVPQVWQGGMSFHGGFIGVIVAARIFSSNVKVDFVSLIDFIAPLVPIGLGLGRLGNFINNELWGSPTDIALGFLVEGVVRHPTQLYEAILEGLILFIILWTYSRVQRGRGLVAAAFLFYYGFFRILIEFFRMPDFHIGYLYSEWLTLGQVLSLPMLILGLWIIIRHKLKEE
ncbi:MAG: prolipoprotein diacylglyceryl transferase [Gammaproteobacteria bacterium]|jgi:phosphatidylglycerol:prolipoprotein diacylglycerol transferase|nr:prolipoprotein diacylglyceryl transferase [Gammaproteobacteria bacterium]MBQ09726.1 prolipoprotein diacylglyceryl transferase [Gammaproteobacteria bacterium]MDP6147061.1 prolipoprotein diacylglyceryl transferase [Gammaproteobacteria bacterium]HJL79585.1 prolipoprotein diacylglyceryl transferase [Gammaproteobacteria bacterium]HJM09069.1 prolipoprotein diacylglyceryl transferase [Gammaproteobacteria bacterium]|tara:strand:+ start:15883 stop:16668 length:786 start_codon:yes stop_codon:yes gene_type:complete